MEGEVDAFREMMDITSDGRHSFEETVESLLALGCEYLDVEVGFLTRIDDGTQLILAAVGDHPGLQTGRSCPLPESYCRRTVHREESVTVQHASIEGWEGDAAYDRFGLESYIGARVVVDGELYGTFCFADSEPLAEPFTGAKVVFVELLAEWASTELARQAVTTDLQRERDRLEEFAGVVSHDLRNPLSVAKGELELAKGDGGDEHLERATDALDRMNVLLNDLLAMAKAGESVGSMEPTSLAAVATQSWQTVETERATLRRETTGTIVADPVRLAQLFENLFANAVEHGGQEATVIVSDIDGGFVVDDDGPGIPTAERPVVTDAGYTTVTDGAGFGLHIVDQIARAHDWTLEVIESPAGGARFQFGDVEFVDEPPEAADACDV